MAVLDVEASDQDTLLGAAELIRQRRIPILQIEVWCTDAPGVAACRTDFPGVQLLLDNGYVLRLTGLESVTSVAEECARRGNAGAFDILAVKEELVGALEL